jgi:hypothetical protein
VWVFVIMRAYVLLEIQTVTLSHNGAAKRGRKPRGLNADFAQQQIVFTLQKRFTRCRKLANFTATTLL